MTCDSWSQSAPYLFNSNLKLALPVLILLWESLHRATVTCCRHFGRNFHLPSVSKWTDPRAGHITPNRTWPNVTKTKRRCVQHYSETLSLKWGTRCSSWFRHCATSRRVAVSIPDWHWLNLLTEMSTRNISLGWGRGGAGRGKSGRCVGLKTLTTFMCRMSWNPKLLKLLEPSEPVRDCTGIILLLHLPFSEITS